MKLLIALLTLLTFNTAFMIPEKIEKKADKVITKFYEIESFSKQVVAISEVLNAKTTADFKEGNLFQIISEEKNLGYGYIGTAPSKTATFEYLILFDKDFISVRSMTRAINGVLESIAILKKENAL